jgi:hypothetical protein
MDTYITSEFEMVEIGYGRPRHKGAGRIKKFIGVILASITFSIIVAVN